MIFFIVTMTLWIFPFKVNENMKAGDLRQMADDKIQNFSRLIYSGRIVSEDLTLKENGITSGAFIAFSIRLRG